MRIAPRATTWRLTLVGGVWAALTAGVGSQQMGPTFRGRSDLVTLDATVVESNGRPVRGLTKNDFVVFEDGRPQSLTTFVALEVPQANWPASWSRDVRQDVVSNEPVSGRLIAIVLDDAILGTDLFVRDAAKQAARQVVADLGPGDRAAVVFTKDSRQAQAFTSDSERLKAAIDRLQPGFVGMGPAGPLGQLTDSQYRLGSLRTTEDVVRMLGASDHRPRALVYIGGGIAINWEAVSSPAKAGVAGSAGAIQQTGIAEADKLRSILRTAQRLGVVVHAIDPSGLGADKDFHRILADNTGGVAVVNTNDVGPGMAAVLDATRSVYLLGYVPSEIAPGLHRIEVQVNRPGVTVRARSLYERLTAPELARLDERKPSLEVAALTGVLPAPAVQLRVFAMPVPFETTSNRDSAIAVVLGVRHPIGGPRATENLVVTTNAFDMEGRFKAGNRSRVQVVMGSSRSEAAAEYEVFSRLQLPPGRYQIRLTVDHRSRNEVGSVFTDVDVPDFRSGFYLSDVLIDAGPTRLKGSPYGLFADFLPVIPTAVREFQVGARFVAFLRLAQGARSPFQSVTLTVRLTDAKGAVLRTTRESLASEQFARGRSTDYRLGFTTDGLTPGRYLLSFEAELPDGAAHRRNVAFDVVR